VNLVEKLLEELAFLPPEERAVLRSGDVAVRVRWVLRRLQMLDRRRFSLRKIARRAGVSAQTLSLIVKGETKRPSASTIARLSHALNVPVAFLMEGQILTPATAGDSSSQFPAFSALSESLRRFLARPENSPYVLEALRLASRMAAADAEPKLIRCAGDLALAAYSYARRLSGPGKDERGTHSMKADTVHDSTPQHGSGSAEPGWQ